MTSQDFDYVRGFVRAEAAIVLEPGKEYLVESRLHALARKENLGSVDDVIRKLRSQANNGLHRKVVDAMTTNETSFFRDIHPFEALRKHILPELIQRHGRERQIQFWCGAASTGQECYSVLMLIREHFPQLMNWNFRFVATDLSPGVLGRARSGKYNQLEVNRGLPVALLVKYFSRQGADWEIQSDLRSRIDFREMNLAQDWPWMPPTDLVFLRNVLIYFDAETKKAILGKIRRILRPGGYLFLGGAETTFGLDEGYERVVLDKTTCYRVKSPQ